MGSDNVLHPLRDQIDAIDREILELLSRRARLAQEIGAHKHKLGLPVFRPERELAVVRKVQQANPGPLLDAGLAAVWTEIMSACRALEGQQRIAYLGPEGTYTELAARRFFGSSGELLPCADLDEVFRSQLGGAASHAVVPVENSTEGAVARALDLLLSQPAHLCGEISLPIHHNLLRLREDLQGVRAVLAHPQALSQCRQWLDSHLAGVERRAVASNAEAARLAAQDEGLAAIAGEHAAGLYGLRLAASHIQDEVGNRTRFVVLGAETPAPSGRDRTSLILSVPNVAGAVAAMLRPLAEHGVSMSRFESRPARSGDWEYMFYVDLEGHADDPPVAAALQALRAHCAFFKNLGSYPIRQD
jgi:chorismate mutase/prephenate dehydratase